MLNWGDKDAAEQLASQLKELLRDRTMTFDQLASVYSIRHGKSVSERLKEMSRNGRPMTLGDFVAQMEDFFEAAGKNQVRARAAGSIAPADDRPFGGSSWAGYPSGEPSRAAGGSVSQRGGAAPAAPTEVAVAPSPMKYADVSKAVQGILKEFGEPISVAELDALFKRQFATSVSDIVGMSTEEYLERKENIFDFNEDRGTVCLQCGMVAGPPIAEASVVKDEVFVVKEFEVLIESMGPIVYISTLCGKFIQRNGVSVTSVITGRPLDLFKRHPGVFLIVGAGNVTLKKYEQSAEVQRFFEKPSSKAHRVVKAAEEAQLPVPQVITEQHVAEEFRRLILADGVDSVYISSLCGRFLQRFKKPVTGIITCKPADFLRRYPDIFVMTGGGNVGLREILGPDAVSVPPPPPRVPKAIREEQQLCLEVVRKIELDDQAFADVHGSINKDVSIQAVMQRLKQICKQIEQASFLALDEVVLGGAVGKGLLSNNPAAEIVCFVRQLPYKNFPQWLPHILDTLGPVLEANLVGLRADRFKVEKDHLKFFLAGGGVDGSGGASAESGGGTGELRVKVFISPVFRDSEHLLESFKACAPAERHYLYPALVRERSDFVGRQPHRRKVLMRLMNWWASKQIWSSHASAPSDWLLEMAAIHACRQLQRSMPGRELEDPKSAEGLSEMVARTMEVLASLGKTKVVWEKEEGGAMYAEQDIPRTLTSSESLFMDPLNPYNNLADGSSFDARDLCSAAEAPGCLLAFQKEAAKWLLRGGGGEGEEGEEGEESIDDDDDEEFKDAEEGLD